MGESTRPPSVTFRPRGGQIPDPEVIEQAQRFFVDFIDKVVTMVA